MDVAPWQREQLTVFRDSHGLRRHRKHFEVLLRAANGETYRDIRRAVGCSPAFISRCIRLYTEGKVNELVSKRVVRDPEYDRRATEAARLHGSVRMDARNAGVHYAAVFRRRNGRNPVELVGLYLSRQTRIAAFILGPARIYPRRGGALRLALGRLDLAERSDRRGEWAERVFLDRVAAEYGSQIGFVATAELPHGHIGSLLRPPVEMGFFPEEILAFMLGFPPKKQDAGDAWVQVEIRGAAHSAYAFIKRHRWDDQPVMWVWEPSRTHLSPSETHREWLARRKTATSFPLRQL